MEPGADAYIAPMDVNLNGSGPGAGQQPIGRKNCCLNGRTVAGVIVGMVVGAGATILTLYLMGQLFNAATQVSMKTLAIRIAIGTTGGGLLGFVAVIAYNRCCNTDRARRDNLQPDPSVNNKQAQDLLSPSRRTQVIPVVATPRAAFVPPDVDDQPQTDNGDVPDQYKGVPRTPAGSTAASRAEDLFKPGTAPVFTPARPPRTSAVGLTLAQMQQQVSGNG